MGCIVCGGHDRAEVHGGTKFRVCTSCGYGALEESTDRGDYWADDHGSLSTETYWVDAKQRYFDATLDLLGGVVVERRLVDIGGGVGFFVERALDHGWDAHSLDISPAATELAAQRIGRERALQSIEQLNDQKVDALTLWCVVAHTRDPRGLVRECAALMRPGGVIWITTPNFTFQKPYSYLYLVKGGRLDFAAHDHVGHFTPAAIRRLLELEGFVDVQFHFRGITETCIVASSAPKRVLVTAKRAWNEVAFRLACRRLPNLVSELQVTARRPPERR